MRPRERRDSVLARSLVKRLVLLLGNRLRVPDPDGLGLVESLEGDLLDLLRYGLLKLFLDLGLLGFVAVGGRFGGGGLLVLERGDGLGDLDGCLEVDRERRSE